MGVIIPVSISVVITVWFTWGGIRDMRRFFCDLNKQKTNLRDDGTVVGHQNLDESIEPAKMHIQKLSKKVQ